MKKGRTCFVFLLIFGFILPAARSQRPPRSAQTEIKSPQRFLQHEAGVTLKLVQVYVTDPDGKPARDLTVSDFILFDNGKRQEISAFEKHFQPVSEETLGQTEPLPSRTIPALMSRKFFFIIDYEGNDLEAVGKSRRAVLEFLDNQVQPGDEIALLSYSLVRGLVIHEFLTADHQKIRTALRKALDIPGISGGWNFGRVILEGETLGQRPAVPEDSERSDEASRGRGSVTIGGPSSRFAPLDLARRLRALGTGLRHIPGQKNVILFCRGFGRDVLRHGTHSNFIFLEMARELASASSPVFSVDTTTGEAKEKVFADGSLEYLSSLTGGKFYQDVNYESEIGMDIQSATSNYYVLGYTITADWDGKFHEIKVEVQKPGYRVFAQKGYFNALPFHKLSAGEKELHLLGLALGEKTNPDRRLDFPLIVLPFSSHEGINTMLISEIPVQRIREVVGASTELISLIFDQNRAIVDGKREVIEWKDSGREKAYHYSTVCLEPGTYDCRIVLRSLETGASALAACTAVLPERKEKGPQLFPPLLLKPEKGVLFLKASQHENVTGTPGAPSIMNVFSFNPNEFTPRMEKTLPRNSEVWASVRCAVADGRLGGLELSAFLEDQVTGERMPLPLRIMSEKDNDHVKTFLLCFPVPELDADAYRFYLVGEDPESGEGSVVGCNVFIR